MFLSCACAFPFQSFNFLKSTGARKKTCSLDLTPHICHHFVSLINMAAVLGPENLPDLNLNLTSIENRIYREEFTGKKSKTAILLYCFHTAGVLHIFMLYNLLGPGISIYRKSKIIVKRKPNYEIVCFHN